MSLEAALAVGLRDLSAGAHSPVPVAIVDSGIDGSHSELADRIERAYAVEAHGDEVRCDPVPLGSPNDAFGHGTAVASIVARHAPCARFTDIRVLDRNNRGGAAVLLAGFARAIDDGCRVINLSLAGSLRMRGDLFDLCERAYRANAMVVASARNAPVADNGFPAELSNCISVDRGDFGDEYRLSWRPPPVEFIAQGEELPAASPGGGMTVMSGTSFATPVVSGWCACLVSRFPELRPFELKAVLKHLARDHAAVRRGRGPVKLGLFAT